MQDQWEEGGGEGMVKKAPPVAKVYTKIFVFLFNRNFYIFGIRNLHPHCRKYVTLVSEVHATCSDLAEYCFKGKYCYRGISFFF